MIFFFFFVFKSTSKFFYVWMFAAKECLPRYLHEPAIILCGQANRYPQSKFDGLSQSSYKIKKKYWQELWNMGNISFVKNFVSEDTLTAYVVALLII